MNKFVKQQLDKCNISLPAYDDNTTQLIIDKIQKMSTDVLPGQVYEVILADYIINEPPNFTLSVNWNNGTKPPEHQMTLTIVDVHGKMIYVSGVGKTTHIQWQGWLPLKSMNMS